MKDKRKLVIIEVICAVLILLFLYAAMSKVLSPDAARHDMLNQPFPRWFTRKMVWLIPGVELLLVVLLIFEKTRDFGLWGSFCLLLIFTLYAVLILLKVFPYVPCGCGGVIRHLSWPQHLLFNLFFTGIAGFALVMRRQLQKSKLNSFNF